MRIPARQLPWRSPIPAQTISISTQPARIRIVAERFQGRRLQNRSRPEIKTGTMPRTNHRPPVDRAIQKTLSRMETVALQGVGAAVRHENRHGEHPLLERQDVPCLEPIEGTDG